MGGLLTGLTEFFGAIRSLAGVAEAFLKLHMDKQMQELGALRQENQVLRAENAELRGRLTSFEALMARPGGLSGAGKL